MEIADSLFSESRASHWETSSAKLSQS